MSTQPAATPPAIAPETIAALDAPAVDAGRAPVMAPEHLAADAASRGPVSPPEHSAQPSVAVTHGGGAQPQVVASIPVHTSNVIMPDEYSKAQANLAVFVGQHLDPQLLLKDVTKPSSPENDRPLLMTFSNMLSDSPEGKLGGTDLQLCFKGEMIEANFAEMQREIIRTLQVHPVISQIIKEHPTLQMEQVPNEEQGQMMHLHLPNLTSEQYAKVIRALAKDSHLAVPPVTTHPAEVLAAAPVVPPVVKEEVAVSEAVTASPTETVPAPVVVPMPPVVTPQPKPLAASVPANAPTPAAIGGVPAEQQQTITPVAGPVVAK